MQGVSQIPDNLGQHLLSGVLLHGRSHVLARCTGLHAHVSSHCAGGGTLLMPSPAAVVQGQTLMIWDSPAQVAHIPDFPNPHALLRLLRVCSNLATAFFLCIHAIHTPVHRTACGDAGPFLIWATLLFITLLVRLPPPPPPPGLTAVLGPLRNASLGHG